VSILKRFNVTRELIQLAIVLFLVEFIRGAIVVSYVPVYGVDVLGVDTAIVGVAITVHYLIDNIVRLFIGLLLDRYSIRLIVHVGLIISIVGLLMMSLASNAWLLILAAAVYGIGVSPIWIVGLSRVSEENRATQMGILYTVWLVGIGSGPVVTNFFLDLNVTASFWGLVVVAFLSWFLSLRLANEKIVGSETVPFRQQLTILKRQVIRMKMLLPGMIIQTTGATMLVPIMPSFAQNELGLSYGEYSVVMIIGGGAAVVSMVPMGKLSDLFGKKWFLVIGFISFAISVYMLSQSSSIGPAILWATFLGLSYASVLPAWNALMASYVPSDSKGVGWGLLSMIEGIGVMLGPVVGGTLAKYLGFGPTMLVTAAMFAFLAAFYGLLPFQFDKGTRTKRKSVNA